MRWRRDETKMEEEEFHVDLGFLSSYDQITKQTLWDTNAPKWVSQNISDVHFLK